MNSVSLIGRLVRDIDIKTTNTGKAVTSFTVAVDRRGDGADFIRCVAYDKTAELLQRYVHKGQQVAIDGRLHTDSYEKDGRRVHTCEVITEHVDLIGGAR